MRLDGVTNGSKKQEKPKYYAPGTPSWEKGRSGGTSNRDWKLKLKLQNATSQDAEITQILPQGLLHARRFYTLMGLLKKRSMGLAAEHKP